MTVQSKSEHVQLIPYYCKYMHCWLLYQEEIQLPPAPWLYRLVRLY